MLREDARADSGDAAVKLHRLHFELVSEDDRRVTYRAIASGDSTQGAALFALTVITATPGSSDEEAELEEFLEQLRAGFLLLGPVAGQKPSESHQPIPFHPRMEILIIPELITVKGDGVFEVVFAVESAIIVGVTPVIGSLTRPLIRFASRNAVGDARWKKKIYFKAKHHRRLRGTVTCSKGKVGVKPGPWGTTGFVDVTTSNQNGVTTRRTRRIIVKGEDQTYDSDFKIQGRFRQSYP